MTPARRRLWLGISAVGTIVVVATFLLFSDLPTRWLPSTTTWSVQDGLALIGFVLAIQVLMLPFDLWSRWLSQPIKDEPATRESPFEYLWLLGVGLQSTVFFLSGLAILAAGRWGGTVAALLVVLGLSMSFLGVQGRLAKLLTRPVGTKYANEHDLIEQQLGTWGYRSLPMFVVAARDRGFTGGIVGWPGREQIVIPEHWFQTLKPSQIAIAVARRVEAIESGARTRGLVLATLWVLMGISVATLLPGAGVQSVAELVRTCLGFTLWSFLGLLWLPTPSRKAASSLDGHVLARGLSASDLHETLRLLNQLQENNVERSTWEERIFHPVPSLANRRHATSTDRVGAWHLARTTLFLSWFGLGLLARAVHCNVGRPELWILLPTD